MPSLDNALDANKRVPVSPPRVQPIPAAQQLALPPPQPGAAFRSQAMGQYTTVQPGAPAPVTPINTGAPVGSPTNPVQLMGDAGRQSARAALAGNVTPVQPIPAATPTPTPTTPTTPPRTANPSLANRAGQVAGKVSRATGAAARLGTSAVESVPGKIPGLRATAPGQRGGTGAALALAGLSGAVTGAGTPTADYATRMGIEEPTGFWGDLGTRALGVMSDVGAAVVDPGIQLGNAVGRGVKALFPGAPDFLTSQAPTLREGFADVQANPDTPTKPTAAQMLAGGSRPAGGAPADGQRPAGDPQPNRQQQQPANEPATGGDEVVGTINGRKITRAESDRLANQNVVTGPPRDAATALATPPRDTGPRLVMPKQNGDRETIEKIDTAISQLGPLDRRSKRDALVDLLGLRSKGNAGDLDRNSIEGRAAADNAQASAASQLAADVDREQIAATTANARRQNTQTITDEAGNVYSVEGKTLTQMTKPDGTPLVAPKGKADNSLQDAALKLLQESAAAGTPMTATDAAAQVAQVAQATQAAQAAPPGTTYAGTKDGVPVYRDAQGRLIQTNQ